MAKKPKNFPSPNRPYHILAGSALAVCGETLAQVCIPVRLISQYKNAIWCEKCWEKKDVAELAATDL